MLKASTPLQALTSYVNCKLCTHILNPVLMLQQLLSNIMLHYSTHSARQHSGKLGRTTRKSDVRSRTLHLEPQHSTSACKFAPIRTRISRIWAGAGALSPALACTTTRRVATLCFGIWRLQLSSPAAWQSCSHQQLSSIATWQLDRQSLECRLRITTLPASFSGLRTVLCQSGRRNYWGSSQSYGGRDRSTCSVGFPPHLRAYGNDSSNLHSLDYFEFVYRTTL